MAVPVTLLAGYLAFFLTTSLYFRIRPGPTTVGRETRGSLDGKERLRTSVYWDAGDSQRDIRNIPSLALNTSRCYPVKQECRAITRASYWLGPGASTRLTSDCRKGSCEASVTVTLVAQHGLAVWRGDILPQPCPAAPQERRDLNLVVHGVAPKYLWFKQVYLHLTFPAGEATVPLLNQHCQPQLIFGLHWGP